MVSSVNALVVLISAAVGMGIGAFWYSPKGFGRQWTQLMGWDEQEFDRRQKEASKSYVWEFVANLVTSFILANIIIQVGDSTAGEGMQTAFWLWLGFIASTMLGMILWEGKPAKLYKINVGFRLVQMLIVGGIMGAWL